ncbi:MAG: hypothetical protein IJC20_04455, partial [Clostridia bacterium]|nr:hypothetical protein [Clostridia bacterium]
MEQRFSFKKLMSIVVVIAMLCSTFMFVVPASAESTNILAGKSYELSGCGVRTTYYAKLTDGLAAADLNGSDRNVDWFGFYCNGTDASIINAPDKVGYAIVDLGQEYNIDKVRTNVICKTSWGIHAPAAVNVYFSADGEEWGEANAFTVELVEGEGKWLELTGEWTANFIKFEYVLAGTFAFTNEIEAYGVAATADDDTSDDESSDVVEDSSDVVEDSSDVVDDSSDVVDDSSDVVDDSSDVVDDSSDVVDDSSDVVDDSSDVIDDSSDVVDDSSDVVDDSSDVVDESSDEVSEEISEDEPVTLQNIALNKNYTTHDPLGGYNANLTDGVKHDAMAYSGDHWFAFK